MLASSVIEIDKTCPLLRKIVWKHCLSSLLSTHPQQVNAIHDLWDFPWKNSDFGF
jgi:hypothetical protein